MKKVVQLFRRNKLGPLGLAGAIIVAAGILFPWKTVAGQGFINGTTDTIGWVLALLSLLYVLILYTHFKWNILLALAVVVMGVYRYMQVVTETASVSTVIPGSGLKMVIAGGLLMIIGTVLLFRKKDEEKS